MSKKWEAPVLFYIDNPREKAKMGEMEGKSYKKGKKYSRIIDKIYKERYCIQ